MIALSRHLPFSLNLLHFVFSLFHLLLKQQTHRGLSPVLHQFSKLKVVILIQYAESDSVRRLLRVCVYHDRLMNLMILNQLTDEKWLPESEKNLKMNNWSPSGKKVRIYDDELNKFEMHGITFRTSLVIFALAVNKFMILRHMHTH